MRALYDAWERTPPVAVMVAGYLGYKGQEHAPKVRDKAGLAAFLADFAGAGGSVAGG